MKRDSGDMVEGILRDWDDVRGFGWIEHGNRRVFAHIRDFKRGIGRPRDGMNLVCEIGSDPQGRPCATRIRITNTPVLKTPSALPDHLLPLPLLALPFAALWLATGKAWLGPLWMLLLSTICWNLYKLDKSAARGDHPRIPEDSLHFIEATGGWPGAILAQIHLRHKSRKKAYQRSFWLIVAAWQVGALLVALFSKA